MNYAKQGLLGRALAHARQCCKVHKIYARGLAAQSASLQWDAHRLSEDQLNFRELAWGFAQQELMPFAADWDRKEHFPVDVLRKAAKLGFGGLFCSSDFGGSKLTRADGAVIFETLAYGDVATTAYLTIHNMCCSLIDKFGSEELRAQWLPRLTTMELLSSYCLTEPDSGSDAASLQTTARQKLGHTDYILNGSKAFISGGGVSDVYLVMARTGMDGPKGITCFLLEKGMAGLSFGRPEHKLGWRSQPTTSITLDNVKVPRANMVGGENEGFKVALSGLDGGRINIAACRYVCPKS
ncbi:hypothetical protein KP509_1Z134100 [Ceratopteris richardii]|nr:hypothetical protein KP509_1Z134100 [Ceratopteris richardii]